ncbi:AAA family ATPase [Clostridium butyricum]|uniref:AAA family ATPase n=1 Tax=Clostridium butyricum TaxID=1492 RepID=UPI0005C25C50|nr:AAA family ATPase [Clostridium butyricum]KIU07772.1 hypothetical protein SC08_Contig83orf01694 [Clostridium butyricum]MBA8967603.1 AAA15 family ATPase/GTPase [Clostridium butyricum]MBA8971330.1 AAA15 family ATPase/GTPase [Clostridium butyricum]MBC2429392.1 AAA family ATPase [Clostridium butyricum]NOW36804.1 AAA15 family ATPase/GTPase [Clostridium butyricum]
MKSVVRLQTIELENLKNVAKGKIAFESYENKLYLNDYYKADVLGIYGANGSGKSSVIEAVDILKTMLLGKRIKKEISNLITYGKDECELEFTFLVEIDDNKYITKYIFKLKYDSVKDRMQVISENLKYSEVDIADKKLLKSKSIIDFNMNNSSDAIFNPISIYNLLLNCNPRNKINLCVSKELAEEDSTSFIFNKRSIKLF